MNELNSLLKNELKIIIYKMFAEPMGIAGIDQYK